MSATATRNILLNLADGSGKLAKALGGSVNTLPELVAGLKKLREQGVDLNTTLELTDKRSVAAFNAFLTAFLTERLTFEVFLLPVTFTSTTMFVFFFKPFFCCIEVALGAIVGVTVGASLGVIVGVAVGTALGVTVGVAVGVTVGTTLGVTVGVTVGASVGVIVGVAVGTALGVTVGVAVGTALGVTVGVIVGVSSG